MIDLEKRQRIMQRSIKLGHCICNPKQGCPCDTFRQKNICPCAGERPERPDNNAKLTSLVEKAGCASKINQSDLKRVLAGLPETSDPRVLVGTNTCDDAGVYLLNDEIALVQTVDVFSPSVDDPYTFGQIAAANSLSDIYAMGGKPLTALSIIGFPIETLSHEAMSQMLLGGMDKMHEAGVVVIGGHSINDQNPEFGYAVTGEISPDKIISNDKARPGDVLILTKPLGTGIISFANQIGKASPDALDAIAASMAALNKTVAEVMIKTGVNAATDVTGFGLLGHLGEMVAQSRVTAEVYANQTPVFDETLDYVAQGIIPGGVERNREFASQRVTVADDVGEEIVHVLYDPQTSGGLLISVPEAKSETMLAELRNHRIKQAAIIGRITGESDGRIAVRMSSESCIVEHKEIGMVDIYTESCCGDNGQSACCASGSEVISEIESLAEDRFGEFMKAVNSDGAIPRRTKELITLALSILSKCEPCVKIHLTKARAMGITEDEINEAVWMAIAFGGAPIKMFYETLRERD